MQQRPLPEARAGEVLVDLLLAGVCHTDIAMIEGNRAASSGYRPVFPLTLGHEWVGVISALGPDVDGPAVGTRVVGSAHVTCGECEHCTHGRSMLCPSLRVLGLDVDGVFAEHFTIPVRNVVAISDDVETEVAAMAEPFAVAVHAVERAGVTAGDSVAVVGPGAVGLLTVAALVASGIDDITVFGVDEDAARLEAASRLGATVQASSRAAARWSGRFDAVIETAGRADAVLTATEVCAPGGRVVCVGLPPDRAQIDTGALARNEKELVGARAYDLGLWALMPDRLRASSSLTSLISAVLPFEQLDKGVDLISSGQSTKVLLRPR